MLCRKYFLIRELLYIVMYKIFKMSNFIFLIISKIIARRCNIMYNLTIIQYNNKIVNALIQQVSN